MKEEDFFNYLTVALRNLGHRKSSVFNIQGELKRLLKTYSAEEIKTKLDKKN
ncbi:hypothetical protein [Candidatus Enterococcus mansonii]|uniref:hypothetical protein n=1 Tax=Candidatus Enterococcus mansonii TaxID=1834181 RepID=UPI0015C4F387|nr:hypothetical protein [Enterococcus sp. 4G2_DIV0659]